MIVVGFYKGHNATACVLKDGKILASASEERFVRIKNVDTFPTNSIKFCLDFIGAKVADVDLFVRTYKHAEGFVTSKGKTVMTKPLEYQRWLAKTFDRLLFYLPSLNSLTRETYAYFSKFLLTPYYQSKFRTNMANFLKVDPQKIIFADHHSCHAYAPYYGFITNEEKKQDYLVITLDGEGDEDCGGIWLVKSGKWEKIATVSYGDSIAAFYGYITSYLGMKINEHEYKVMGLAPYVSEYEIKKVYPIFKDLFWIDDNLVMHSKIHSGSYPYYLEKYLRGMRFDGIAGAAQLLAENVAIDLVKKAIRKTGIKNIILSGGFFMNVKVNQKIAKLSEVKRLFVCPSASDESSVFGAAYFGFKYLCKEKGINFRPETLDNLYLGPNFEDKGLKKAMIKAKISKKYKINKYKNIEKVIADLLAEGKIVGRFTGRMEWGARALGNRSILMDPRSKDKIRELNDQVKSRDFWMPFAATIIDEYKTKYLRNTDKSDGRFMVMAYDTTDLGKKNLSAAIHPYDETCRPQILSRIDNPKYYKLIKYFQGKTGVGAVLNTSFNYHGEPIVCTPDDALHTFEVTGLKYLALENCLIAKE
ncbi:hypothetical protein A2715_04985 [Candidatus Woesebacteria bacterium RIFCSPHIGHO2_01_FULL_39_32]|uniref:Carbamoyl transferase n=1 Tax=Candidatus Woesebacteria bacterium RIFCSPLOWO2_01_FULL_39_25 TaxID=1802521 RepID=A0A1F8BNG7_9BACT|nr:MAG: hypothetical protein A2124_00730 [Candidatus Woesebacteria bacterium GWB1_37_5]OGM25374.1 MAG: hypothetical protein A2715_04985 [Candidatus Woesebacteria bacterium RIFCSPHIGHO2_01_FULL_39_32]OGM38482.1 MAG: hypothetical protein A3F01_03940 [Candidatus Woesebacteria bacterium RIFCSPHIGHO2_12_FULL_38_11]OGM64905.1 MAG: hypothetical protein A2893_04595 [Candidatus Woesebacteria bacterium RIFCSPLOWO2_01_FULL_39_25]